MAIVHFPLILSSSHMIAPAVRHFAFARDDGQALPFIPGQFLQVHFAHNGAMVKRSYSLANAPGTSALEIAVSYVEGGAATSLFKALQDGQSVEASGPYGRFCLGEADTNARYLLIGTGTGITPYRAMLPQIASLMQSRGLKVALIQGARNPGELLYGDEFATFADAHPGFDYYPCFSREDRGGAWRGDRRGYVQNVLDEINANAAGDVAYLCGNPNMVDQTFEALKAKEFPVSHVRREKYVSSK
jgi:ferredoxin-NADP reductase